MTIKTCLLLLIAGVPAAAPAREAPYYGPMHRLPGWMNLGMSVGYEVKTRADGRWQVTAVMRRGDALSVAMYRAAEMARQGGYPYVQFLRGRSSGYAAINTAVIDARPADSAEAPTGCPLRGRGACYTADAAEVLRILGGPDGTEPGVAIVDHVDRFGRNVTMTGFGIGAVAPGMVTSQRAFAKVPRTETPVPGSAPMSRQTIAAERLAQALKDQQPIRGRDSQQGWTISD